MKNNIRYLSDIQAQHTQRKKATKMKLEKLSDKVDEHVAAMEEKAEASSINQGVVKTLESKLKNSGK